MKKIFALTLSMILLISILIPAASSCEIPKESTSNGVAVLSTGNPEDAITVEKTIKDGENWVDSYNGNPGELIRFRIKITYDADWDGDPLFPGDTNGYMIKDITIIDKLPLDIEYIGNSSHEEYSISFENNTITWKFDTTLLDDQSISVEYDTAVDEAGIFVNNVYVTATESCYGKQRNASAYATVVVSDCIDCPPIKCRDIDNDNLPEFAIDENNDSSDGYEVFRDPDRSSDEIIKIDGDNDSKIDHFIDINKDGKPDKYWDPDDDILSLIYILDVDYDGTYEWVFDSDDDFYREPDKYYDPDDQRIHDYIVYELTITIDPVGSGIVQKTPNGLKYLKNFVVNLSAVASTGWTFEKYSGDRTSTNPKISITINSDIEITAHFKNNENDDELPFVEIIKPLPGYFYFFNIGLNLSLDKTKIVGPINIRVNATSDNEIEKVEFYINGEYKKNDTKADSKGIYSWLWLFKPLGREQNFTITVKAYDKEGNYNTDSIDVTRTYPKYLIGIGLVGLVLLLFKNMFINPNEKIPVEPDNDTTNQAPYIRLNVQSTGVVGEPVSFDASGSTDPDGDSLTFEWDFGDGSTGSGEKTTHKYDKPGVYHGEVRVTDSKGNYDTEQFEVEITEGSEEPIGGDEDGLFWYIVSALAAGLATAVGLLYVWRKLYV